jgi:hypothetical protein
MGLELRVVTSLPLLPKFFIIFFVQVEPFIINGGSIRFGVPSPGHRWGKSNRSIRLERHDKLTGTVVSYALRLVCRVSNFLIGWKVPVVLVLSS